MVQSFLFVLYFKSLNVSISKFCFLILTVSLVIYVIFLQDLQAMFSLKTIYYTDFLKILLST